MPYRWVARELTLGREYKRGDKGGKVRNIQEWLSLQGQSVSIDGAFGPATEAAVRRFQTGNGIAVTGTADKTTFAALVEPLAAAVTPITAAGRTLNDMILAYANQHLVRYPLEVGGQNCGPWVRVYMEGNQGSDWPWCAGFACFILRQAADALGKPMPFKPTFSCDVLASQAISAGRFIPGSAIAKGKVRKSDILPGSLFVSRRTDNDWNHTGIAIAFHDDYFETIEGNTNDAGDREGYEVCRRTRGYGGKDFVKI